MEIAVGNHMVSAPPANQSFFTTGLEREPVAFPYRVHDEYKARFMPLTHRSDCPINLAIEVVGDRWTLLVLRDIMFGGRQHFRSLLEGSEEGISPSVLAERLQRLTQAGILRRECCATHRQKGYFRLTEMGADLVPVIAALGAWGARHREANPEQCDKVLQLERGGQDACCALKAKLLADQAPEAATGASA
ncbi:winged helix-turn-helix transcriptional regulator [Pseudoroseicyclus sp. H15]